MELMAGEMRHHCQRVVTPVREIRLHALDPEEVKKYADFITKN